MPVTEEDEIRERAYFRWLEEGCPDGRAEDHWHEAAGALRGMAAAMKAQPKAAKKTRVGAAAKRTTATRRKKAAA